VADKLYRAPLVSHKLVDKKSVDNELRLTAMFQKSRLYMNAVGGIMLQAAAQHTIFGFICAQVKLHIILSCTQRAFQ
jgi:hypothetical protein